MKFKVLVAAALVSTGLAVRAEVDPEHHKLCSEAKDYAGCIAAMTGQPLGMPASLIDAFSAGRKSNAMWAV